MSGMREFCLPDLGEGLTEAEIVGWRVAVGDTVEVDQVVVEVETAKAAVEVPCPYGGVVSTLHGRPGDVLAVGAPLVTVAAAAADGPEVEAAGGSGRVLVGYGTQEGTRRARRDGRVDLARTGRRDTPAPTGHAHAHPAKRTAPRVISPIVRQLARGHGVDVAALAGSGPGGVVLRRDVESAIGAAAPRPEAVPATAVPAGSAAGERRTPIRGPHRAMAEKMTRSRREIPDATTWVDVDATELVAARDALDAGREGDVPRIGVLALLARMCLEGLRRFPDLNAYVDVERQEVVTLPYVHLGFAAQTGRGLVVPVVRDAHAMSTERLATQIARLTGAARAGRLTPAECRGGTFTLNNYGVFGVDGSNAVINHPEVAILGVGRLARKPWVVDDELRVRTVTQLSLSFDHRVCDGGTAGGFLRYVADLVERPYALLRHL